MGLTIGFILCAYLLYALIRALIRRAGMKNRRYQPWRRRQLTLANGVGLGAGLLFFLAVIGLPAPSENLRYASMISAVGSDVLNGSARKQARQEIPPLKNLGDPGRPIYVYLHPETPSPQLTPEKESPQPLPKQKARQPKLFPQSKASKSSARLPKQAKDNFLNLDKIPQKPRVLKKKPSRTAGKPNANSG